MNWAELLQRGPATAEASARGVDVILRNARLQTQLVNDVLDVSRIVTGQLRIETAPVNLRQVIEAALESIEPAAVAKGLRLDRALEDVGTVRGDFLRLQQVAWNLLSNAVKFTPRDGRIAVTLEPAPGEALLSVADTGAGIEPAFIPHVFERFRQADASTTRAHGGLGLGLAIVRHVVELHGGTVSAASRGAGRGTTFTVRLPALSVGAAAGAPS